MHETITIKQPHWLVWRLAPDKGNPSALSLQLEEQGTFLVYRRTSNLHNERDKTHRINLSRNRSEEIIPIKINPLRWRFRNRNYSPRPSIQGCKKNRESSNEKQRPFDARNSFSPRGESETISVLPRLASDTQANLSILPRS